MKKTRRFKSKGWYGVGEDEGFDPMFDVEIVREMDVGPIVYWDYGFIMKSCNEEIRLFERTMTDISKNEDRETIKYELEVLNKTTNKLTKYRIVEVEQTGAILVFLLSSLIQST